MGLEKGMTEARLWRGGHVTPPLPSPDSGGFSKAQNSSQASTPASAQPSPALHSPLAPSCSCLAHLRAAMATGSGSRQGLKQKREFAS